MPVKAFLLDDQWCVHEVGKDGQPGELVGGCYDDPATAEAIVLAFNNGIQEIWHDEFRGPFPEVPTAEGVDVAALTAVDREAGSAPYFITLEFAADGAVGKSKLRYDPDFVQSLVDQINDKRPIGLMGHLRDEDLNSAHPIAAIHWVGAMRTKKGKAYAKGYIPPGPVREHYQRVQAVGGKAATSIFGPAPQRRVAHPDGTWSAEGFVLDQLDLAPPGRASLSGGSAFRVTAEIDNRIGDEILMTERETVIQNLTAADVHALPAAVREAIIQSYLDENERTDAVTEISTERDRLQNENTTLQTQVREMQTTEIAQAIDSGIATLFEGWQVTGDSATGQVASLKKALRARIVAKMGDDPQKDAVTAVIREIWDHEFKSFAETIRDALSGPNQIGGGSGASDNPEQWREELTSEAKVKEITERWGIGAVKG